MSTASQAAKARVPGKADEGAGSGSYQHGKRLSDRLSQLADADRQELQDQWLQAFGVRPPVRLSSELLLLGLSYDAQCGSNGGLSPDQCLVLGLDGPDWLAGPRSVRHSKGDEPTRAKPQALVDRATTAADEACPARAKPRPVRRSIKPGTRLLREWQGQTHEVIAESTGQFLYRGETYRSLSAIARAITGTRWSGPTFFGIATPGQARTSQARTSLAVACDAQITGSQTTIPKDPRGTACASTASVAANFATSASRAKASLAIARDDLPSETTSSAVGNHRHSGPRNE